MSVTYTVRAEHDPGRGEGHFFLFARINETVGRNAGALRMSYLKSPNKIRIDALDVLPDHVDRVRPLLLEHLEKYAKQVVGRRLILVETDNDELKQFYLRNGFQQIRGRSGSGMNAFQKDLAA